MFWGLILKSNKRYTQMLEKSFHLAQATLETSTANDSDVQVWFSNDEQSYLLCTLRKNTLNQTPLNLNFTSGDKVTFYSKGSGVVHLTGSILPEGFDDDFGSDSDDDEIAEEKTQKSPEKPTKTKEERKEKAGKPAKIEEDDEDDDMDEDDEVAVGQLESDDEDDSDDEDEDDDDLSDDDGDNESSDEEKIEEQPKKKQKLDNKKSVQNGIENGKQNSKEAAKPNKQANQNQHNKGKGNKLVLQGGVVAFDKQTGNGKEAKAGKKIAVYYEGRLKDTNKIFDSTKQGPGFKFTLGRGEVIKGWDIGVAGMKVGGKRTINIPAHLAYGSKGFPPTIPGNAQLVFDVELKNVF